MQKADEIHLPKYVRGRCKHVILALWRIKKLCKYKCKKQRLEETVIGDVLAHLKQQKFTVLLNL